LLAAIANSPVEVAINAGNLSFQAYSGGIYNDPLCSTTLNHVMTIVGYGTESGLDYYLVRNDWGSSWGEDGYIKIARNGDGAGVCGIQRVPEFAITT